MIKNKKAFALVLTKPALWILYIIIVAIFLAIFTVSGIGSSGRDASIVSEEMPDFITTIEALNYLRKPVGDATVYDLLTSLLKRKDYLATPIEEDAFTLVETLTNGLIKVKDVQLEDEAYTFEGERLREKHYTMTLSVSKPGSYRKTQEVELYLPSNLKDYSYIKLLVEVPYGEKE